MMSVLGERLLGNPYPLYAILRRLRPVFRAPFHVHGPTRLAVRFPTQGR